MGQQAVELEFAVRKVLHAYKALHAVYKLDKNSPGRSAADDTVKGFSQMPAHIFRHIALFRLAFRPLGSQLARRGQHGGLSGKILIFFLKPIHSDPFRHSGQNAVNGGIRITADRRGEVAVIIQIQSKVP